MEHHLDDLTINISQLDIPDLLDCWQWRVKDMDEVLIISKLGDMFLIGKDTAVYWLATDDGSLTQIARNASDFTLLLKDDMNVDNWFLPLLIGELEAAGKFITKNQVYSYLKMPALGGAYSVENIIPADISVHFTITGQICEQIKDLPEGTKVNLKIGG